MASFRSSLYTEQASSSEITADLPVGIVAGDLLVMFITKSQTDEPVTPTGWFALGSVDHGIGARQSSMAGWTVATAAMVALGTVDIVCTTSSNDATMHAQILAFDISDWAGLRWNTSDFTHATSGTSLAGSELATVFVDGISLVFHSVGVTSRTGEGTTTEGGVVIDDDDTAVISTRVWYNVAEAGELAQTATVAGTGTMNRTQTGFACFGPSPQADGEPCPDPDGLRVSF